MNYQRFIETKSQFTSDCGFECDDFPEIMFDFQVTHSGPFTNKAMFPAVDSTWFMVIAEREVGK